MENHNEMELDLRDLYYYLKKKLWIIALVFALCAVLGFVYSLLFITPKYEAVTRMYVLNRTNEANVVYADMIAAEHQICTQRLNSFRSLKIQR